MAKSAASMVSALKKAATAPDETPKQGPAYYVPPSREGKLHLSVWLSPDFKTSLRAIQMRFPNKSLKDLHAEALNDLFSKYNVPVVRDE